MDGNHGNHSKQSDHERRTIMGGSNMGMSSVHLTGARITRQPIYIPAHEKNGKTISAKLLANVAVNHKSGGYERTDYYDIVVWGKRADTCALTCSIGKELHLRCRPESYRGKVYKNTGPGQKGEIVLNDDGTPALTNKVTFVVERGGLNFGADAQNVINQQIAAKPQQRPTLWNRPDLDNKPDGQKDADIWSATLKEAMSLKYDGQSPTFGYAKVLKPMADAAPAPALQNQVAEAAGNGDAVGAFFNQAKEMASSDGKTVLF